MKDVKELKADIIAAGYRAVEQLIKVAKEDIIKPKVEEKITLWKKIKKVLMGI